MPTGSHLIYFNYTLPAWLQSVPHSFSRFFPWLIHWLHIAIIAYMHDEDWRPWVRGGEWLLLPTHSHHARLYPCRWGLYHIYPIMTSLYFWQWFILSDSDRCESRKGERHKFVVDVNWDLIYEKDRKVQAPCDPPSAWWRLQRHYQDQRVLQHRFLVQVRFSLVLSLAVNVVDLKKGEYLSPDSWMNTFLRSIWCNDVLMSSAEEVFSSLMFHPPALFSSIQYQHGILLFLFSSRYVLFSPWYHPLPFF